MVLRLDGLRLVKRSSNRIHSCGAVESTAVDSTRAAASAAVGCPRFDSAASQVRRRDFRRGTARAGPRHGRRRVAAAAFRGGGVSGLTRSDGRPSRPGPGAGGRGPGRRAPGCDGHGRSRHGTATAQPRRRNLLHWQARNSRNLPDPSTVRREWILPARPGPAARARR